MKRALIHGLLALGGVLAAATVTAGVVRAHATLVSADPANGAMLTVAPDHVELVFSETVGMPAALAVLDSAGTEVEGSELQVADDTIKLTITTNFNDKENKTEVEAKRVKDEPKKDDVKK